MARRKSRKAPSRRRRKRTYKKRGGRRLPKTILRCIGGRPFPEHGLVKFKTVFTSMISTTAQADGVTFGGIDSNVQLNWLQAPFGIVQGYGHDEYAGIYNNFRVLHAKWKLEITNITNPAPATFIAQVNNNSGSGLTTTAVAMQPRTQMAVVGAVTGGKPYAVLRGNVAMHKVFGVSKSKYNSNGALYDGTLAVGAGTDPSSVCILRFAATSTQAAQYKLTFTLWQTTRVFNPDMLAQS